MSELRCGVCGQLDHDELSLEYHALQAKYEKALDLIEDLSNQYCSSEHVDVWAKKANKLLKELGENE